MRLSTLRCAGVWFHRVRIGFRTFGIAACLLTSLSCYRLSCQCVAMVCLAALQLCVALSWPADKVRLHLWEQQCFNLDGNDVRSLHEVTSRLQNDFTPEEEEAVRKENQWAFE